jgi:hypothetical protein
MFEGEGGENPDGPEARSVAHPPTPPAEPFPSAGPVPASMVLGYVDLAITGTLDYERYRGVYVGPWWILENVPEGVHAWKRAVLRRVPGHGAEHWGHLYLIVRYSDRESLSWFTRDWRGRRAPKPPTANLVLRKGEVNAELALRSSDPAQSAHLEEFAREISERFRRQMD